MNSSGFSTSEVPDTFHLGPGGSGDRLVSFAAELGRAAPVVLARKNVHANMVGVDLRGRVAQVEVLDVIKEITEEHGRPAARVDEAGFLSIRLW